MLLTAPPADATKDALTPLTISPMATAPAPETSVLPNSPMRLALSVPPAPMSTMPPDSTVLPLAKPPAKTVCVPPLPKPWPLTSVKLAWPAARHELRAAIADRGMVGRAARQSLRAEDGRAAVDAAGQDDLVAVRADLRAAAHAAAQHQLDAAAADDRGVGHGAAEDGDLAAVFHRDAGGAGARGERQVGAAAEGQAIDHEA